MARRKSQKAKEPPQLKPYLTISQAAALLGVHPDTLRNWDRSGKLIATRHPLNGYRLYARTQVEQLASTLMEPPQEVT